MSIRSDIMKELPRMIAAAVATELKTNWKGLKNEHQARLTELLTLIAEERIALALTDDVSKIAKHKKNLEHYEAALASLKAVTKIKAYNATINIIGRVMAEVLLAAGKAII